MHCERMLAILLVALSPFTSAQCVVESAPTRPHLVELYSSEGCSSCPPAEQWLRTLHDGADVVALEFHVDYWDGLGWRDRFASARYTQRQRSIAARDGSTTVYTPQVVLDGRSWACWYRGGRLTPPASAALSMKLVVQTGAKLHVRVDTQAVGGSDDAGYRNYIALVEDGLASQVRAGENRGVTLRHDHVVRAFAGPLPLARAQADLMIPGDVDLAHASLIAFAQNPLDGAIAQVASLPLAQCR
ncbi:MAG: DUF1223 domain-containing protein [Rudaea sp.]